MNNILSTASYLNEEYIKASEDRQIKNFSSVFEKLLKKYKMISPGKILIVECNKGYDAVLAAKNGFDVTAISFPGNSIVFAEKLAYQNSVKINFFSNDILLTDNNLFFQFDYVFIYVVFNAVESFNRKEYFKKISFFLKPAGKLITLLLPAEYKEDERFLNLNIKNFYKEVSEFFKLEFSTKIINSGNNTKGEVLQIYVKPN